MLRTRNVSGIQRAAPAAVPITARRRLTAICVGGAVAAAAVAGLLGEKAGVPIAAQITAPPPFGVFHDLRWVLVFHNSWAAFAGEIAAMLGFRTALTTALLAASWPSDVERPPLAAMARRAFAFTVLLVIALLPWAVVLFAAGVAPISWMLFVGVPSVLLVALAMYHALGSDGWWRRIGPLRGAAWIVFAFIVLSVAAAVMAATPFPASLIPVAVTGVFNAWAWHGVTSAVVRPRRRAAIVSAPVALALVVLMVVAGTVVGFDVHSASRQVRNTPASARLDTPVLVVSGFDSEFNGTEPALFARDDLEQRFSYRGLDARGRPLPYTARDTTRGLDELVQSMSTQVDALAGRTGHSVSIVAESEGSLVAADYIATRQPSHVARLVMESPLIDPGRVWYPPRGRQGWGVATGYLLRGVGVAVGALSARPFPPDAPLFRSLVDEGPAVRRLRSCFPSGVREVVLFPLADAVAAPFSTTSDVDVHVVPAFHGGLLTNDSARRTVLLALRGVPIPRHFALREANLGIRAAASAWHVPPLPDGLNPRWRRYTEERC